MQSLRKLREGIIFFPQTLLNFLIYSREIFLWSKEMKSLNNIIKLNLKTFKELKSFIILWSTQSLSQLGSAITGFALTLWLYEKTGSALSTASLTICSYTPYILMSIFAGALSDKWNKKNF